MKPVCAGCKCDETQNGLPIIKGPGGVCLCVTCAGMFYLLVQSVLREVDDRARAQASDERERLES